MQQSTTHTMVDIHPITLFHIPKCICNGQPSYPFLLFACTRAMSCTTLTADRQRIAPKAPFGTAILTKREALKQATCACANSFYIWWNLTNSY